MSRTTARFAYGSIVSRPVASGPQGPPGPPVTPTILYFTWASPTPILLCAVEPGNVVNQIVVIVEEPFDGGASLTVGSTAAPSLLLCATDCDLSRSDQYASFAVTLADAPDFYSLYLTPRGATRGRATLVVYTYG